MRTTLTQPRSGHSSSYTDDSDNNELSPADDDSNATSTYDSSEPSGNDDEGDEGPDTGGASPESGPATIVDDSPTPSPSHSAESAPLRGVGTGGGDASPASDDLLADSPAEEDSAPDAAPAAAGRSTRSSAGGPLPNSVFTQLFF